MGWRYNLLAQRTPQPQLRRLPDANAHEAHVGLSFRRSIKMGPLRLNLSSSGMGVSTGVRGARVSFGPRGTYVTIGRGGFQYRTKLTDSPPPNRATVRVPGSPASVPSSFEGPNTDSEGFIPTASAAELALASPSDVLAEIQVRLTRTNWTRVLVITSLLLSAIAHGMAPSLSLVVLVVGLVAAASLYRWDRDRRSARLFYDVDDPRLVERLAAANAAGHHLAQSASLWHIYYSVATNDYKMNAGAGKLIRRTPVRCAAGTLPGIELNVEPWSIPVGPQRLLFLPDQMIVWDGKQAAGLPYDVLDAELHPIRFVEDSAVPRDAVRVDTTWRYVNKKGGPDRRFNNNAQLPVLQYGQLELTSPTGLRIVLQTSTVAAAEGAHKALRELRRLAEADRAGAATTSDSATAPSESSATASAQAPAAFELAKSVALLLKYIASADRKLTDAEAAFARKVIDFVLPSQPEAAGRVFDAYSATNVDSGRMASAARVISNMPPDYRSWVLRAMQEMSTADGKATPKELERIAEISRELGA